MLRNLIRKIHCFDTPGIQKINLRGSVDQMVNHYNKLNVEEKLGMLEVICQNSEF